MVTTPHYFKTIEEASGMSDSLLLSIVADDLENLAPGYDKTKAKVRVEMKEGRVEFWGYVED